MQKRILFPQDTGGKIRTLNVLRYLSRWHDVTYLCNSQAADAPYLEKMRALRVRLETIPWQEAPRSSWRFFRDLGWNLFSPYPFTASKDFDRALRARAGELLAKEPFDLVICDFVQMARNAIGLDVGAKILFQHNVEAQLFRRHAEADGNWLLRQYMAHQWRKMRRFEARAGRHFDAVIAVSEQDKRTFEREYGWQHVHTIDTAVDTDYFSPGNHPSASDRIVFVGSMDWLPNQDGVQYFVREIWPAIRHSKPRATFQIVGRNPSRSISHLQRIAGVETVGTVPDVRPYLAEASVVVVPLRIGGGTRIKIFEAMAMGKAVVSTALGAEGLPVVSDKHLFVRDDPGGFADEVIRLLDEPAVAAKIGTSACEFVRENYSAERVARQFDDICQRVVRDVDKAPEAASEVRHASGTAVA